MSKFIFLVGYMGCGKTTIGKKLARKLCLSFEDTDSLVEKMVGASVADIFYYEGETKFRALERAVLEHISEIDQPIVIATGGGLPVHGDNMKILNELGSVFYIKRKAEQIIKRLSPFGIKKRPKLLKLKDEELLDFISAEIKQREQFYMQAHRVVDCSSMSDRFIVDYIISNLDYGK